jgi:hypothetical protein
MHELSSFSLGPCSTCQEECLTLSIPTAPGQMQEFVCVHCNSSVSTVRWVTADELVEQGYRLDGAGLGNSKRGCRSGACGVRQLG